jgi:hypothetical protein
MVTKAALLLRKPLLFLTFGTTAIHFPAVQVVLKKKTTTLTFTRSGLNCRPTAGNWTFKNGFAVTAPVFSLKRLLTLLTSLNSHHSLQYLK